MPFARIVTGIGGAITTTVTLVILADLCNGPHDFIITDVAVDMI
jgi:hypothetical protein